LLLAESKRQTDFWHERGNGEPNEEGGKEAKPREVERAHVGALNGRELDFGGHVILVGINIDVISLIFLYFGLAGWKTRHDEYFWIGLSDQAIGELALFEC